MLNRIRRFYYERWGFPEDAAAPVFPGKAISALLTMIGTALREHDAGEELASILDRAEWRGLAEGSLNDSERLEYHELYECFRTALSPEDPSRSPPAFTELEVLPGSPVFRIHLARSFDGTTGLLFETEGRRVFPARVSSDVLRAFVAQVHSELGEC